MTPIERFIWWGAGEGRYMRLDHCMGHDWPWIWATIGCNLATAAGYCLIAWNFWRQRRAAGRGPAARLLAALVMIFTFCGFCGYLSPVLEMVWPARRLVVFARLILIAWTWYYALNAPLFRLSLRQLSAAERLAQALREGVAAPLRSIQADLHGQGAELERRLAEVSANLEFHLSGAAGQPRLQPSENQHQRS